MFLPGLWRIVAWRVRRLSEGGKSEKAVRFARSYVRLRPDDIEGWVDLGDCLLRVGKVEDGVATMRAGLARYPGQPRLVSLLAVAYLRQGQIDEAEEALASVDAASPEASLVSPARVRAARARGDFETAVEVGRTAAERIPSKWAWARFDVASALIPIPGGRTIAEGLLTDAAAHLPRSRSRHAMSHLLLGALIENRDPAAAQEHFDEARRSWRHPSDPDELLSSTRRLLRAREGTEMGSTSGDGST